MDTYIDMLYHEKAALKEKIYNLEAFIISDKIANVPIVQVSLINIQHSAMKTYLSCLEQRIEWMERTIT